MSRICGPIPDRTPYRPPGLERILQLERHRTGVEGRPGCGSMDIAIAIAVASALIVATLGLAHLQARWRFFSPHVCDVDDPRLPWNVVAGHLRGGQGTLVIFAATQPSKWYVWIDATFPDDSSAIDAACVGGHAAAYATIPSFLCYCSTRWMRYRFPLGRITVCRSGSVF